MGFNFAGTTVVNAIRVFMHFRLCNHLTDDSTKVLESFDCIDSLTMCSPSFGDSAYVTFPGVSIDSFMGVVEQC